jgi:hypothetical protein
MSSNDGNDDRSGAKRPLESGAEEPANNKQARGEFRWGMDLPAAVPERQLSGGFTFGAVRSVIVKESVAFTSNPRDEIRTCDMLARKPRCKVTTSCNRCSTIFTYIHAEGLPDDFTKFCERCRTLRETMVSARSVQAVAQPVQAVAEPVRAVAEPVQAVAQPAQKVRYVPVLCWECLTTIHIDKQLFKLGSHYFCSKECEQKDNVLAVSVQVNAQPVQAVAEPVRAVQASAGSGSGGARSSQAERDLGSCGYTPTMIYCNICGHENKLNSVQAAMGDRHCKVCKKYVNCTNDNCTACAKPMDNPPKATGNVIRTFTFKCFRCMMRHRMERAAGYKGSEPYWPSTHGRQHCQFCRQFTTCSDQANCAMCKGDGGLSAADAWDNAGGERGIQMRQYDCPKCGQQHFEARNESNPVWRKFNALDKKHCAECKDRVECTDATCAVCVPPQSAAGVVAGGAQAGAGGAGPARVENGTPKFSDTTLYCKNCKQTIEKTSGVPKPGDDICNLCKTKGHVVRTYTYTCPDCKITHTMEKPAKSTVDDPYKAAIMGRPYCQRCRLFSSCDNPTTCGCPKCGKAARADFAINAALVAARAAQAGAGSAGAVQAGVGSASGAQAGAGAVQAGAGSASAMQAGAGSGASGGKTIKTLKFIRSVDKAAIAKWDITMPLDHGINTNISRVPVVERRILHRHDEYINGLFEAESVTALKVSKLEKTVAEQAQKLEAQAKELEELRRIVDELRRKGDGGA